MSANRPRVASLLPAATEMICGAGLRDCLVGVSHECNWPPDVIGLPRLTRSRVDSTAASGAIDAEVKSLFAAGEPLYEIDAERLATLAPTLIVTQAQCDVCAVSYESVLELVATQPALAATRVLALNPRSLDEAVADVERIGAAAGAECPAKSFAASLRTRIEAVRAVAGRDDGPKPRVLVVEWTEPLMIAGNWTPELVTIAGGDYGLATAGEHSRYVAWDQVRQFAPDLLIVAPCGFDLPRSRREAEVLARLPGWHELPAVRSGRVVVVDGDAYFNRPGPRLVDSLEFAIRAIRGC